MNTSGLMLSSNSTVGFAELQIVPNFPTHPAREWGFGTVFGCGLLSGLVLTLLAAALWIVICQNCGGSSSATDDEEPIPQPSGKHAPATMHLFSHRCMWLVGLLLTQSVSAVVLSHFSKLLLDHLNIVYFLTMLVGAGGNAGAQSAVLVVRELALKLDVSTMEQILMGAKISTVLALVAVIRTFVTGVIMYEVLAIVMALVLIIMVSVILGTLLPLGMDLIGIDPGHSLPVVQVLMDILGVTITCMVGHVLLDRILDAPDEAVLVAQTLKATQF